MYRGLIRIYRYIKGLGLKGPSMITNILEYWRVTWNGNGENKMETEIMQGFAPKMWS